MILPPRNPFRIDQNERPILAQSVDVGGIDTCNDDIDFGLRINDTTYIIPDLERARAVAVAIMEQVGRIDAHRRERMHQKAQ